MNLYRWSRPSATAVLPIKAHLKLCLQQFYMQGQAPLTRSPSLPRRHPPAPDTRPPRATLQDSLTTPQRTWPRRIWCGRHPSSLQVAQFLVGLSQFGDLAQGRNNRINPIIVNIQENIKAGNVLFEMFFF